MVAVLPFDWQVHDTYFIVGHLHYVLIGGVVFPVFAALYHWLPLINGHTLSERWARWIFGLMFGGFNLAFFPMHASGLLGMPRRVYTYADGLGLNTLNLLSTMGAFVFAAGVMLFFTDLLRTLRRRAQRRDNPWHAGTLEWLPTDGYGTRSIPQVASREPLWQRPALAAEVEAGRHWLPGTVTGLRETIVTSARAARMLHVIVLPGDGWLPLLAGVGTAGFFLLLTAKFMVTATVCGIGAVAATLLWLWDSDHRPAGQPTTATVGDGVELPIGAPGAAGATAAAARRSHSWWATLILVVVDATIFASFAFAHLHVSMLATVCPPPGARLPADASAWACAALWALAAAAMGMASRSKLAGLQPPAGAPARTRTFTRITLLVAMAWLLAAGAFSFGLHSHLDAGLAPRANAWSATVAALLSWQAFHMAIITLMAAYLLARLWCGRLSASSRATLDNIGLFWRYTALQGALVALLVQLLPRAMG